MKILIGILLMISVQGNAAIQRSGGSGVAGVSTTTFVNGAGSGETNKLAKWSDPSTLTTTNWSELGGNLQSTGSMTASSGTFSGGGSFGDRVIIATGSEAAPSLRMIGHASGLFSSGNNRLDLVGGARNILRILGDAGVDDRVLVFGRLDCGNNCRAAGNSPDAPAFANSVAASNDTGAYFPSENRIAFSNNGSKSIDILPDLHVHFSSGITASSGTFSGEVRAATFNAVGTAYQMRGTTLIDTGMNLSVASGTFTGTITAPGMNFSSSGSTLATNGVFTISTSPTAGTAGDVAFQINQNAVITSTTQYRGRYVANVSQSVNTNTLQPVYFTVEQTDVGNMHSNTVSSDTITIPTGGDGWYQINCTIEYASSSTGVRKAFIYVNGVQRAGLVTAPQSLDNNLILASTGVQLNSGDIVKCIFYHERSIPLTISDGGFTNMSIVKVW